MNDFVELRRVTAIILRRWWLLVLLTAISAMIGYAVSQTQTPVYDATATVLVGESIRSTRVDRVDIQVSEALVQTYVELARRQPVLEGVVTTLALEESWQSLSKRVTITYIEGTQLIEITVEANKPEKARMIADEIVNQMILLSPTRSESAGNEETNNFNRQQIADLQARIAKAQNRLAEIEAAMSNSISEIELAELQKEKTTLEELLVGWQRNYTELLTLTEPKKDPTQLTIIESAYSSNRIIRPRVQLNTILGGVLGMLVALGLIILMDFLDDTYKSLDDFSRSEDLKPLGGIKRIKGRKLADHIVASLHPHSPITESYRIIRSRIRVKPAENSAKSIMVSSSMPKEGRSVSVANLAIVFAQANYKTVIIDADLRHPVLHQVFNVGNETGLGDALASPEIKIEECLQDTSVNNLQILTSGNPLPDPSGQLGSERMAEILADLKKLAQIVILDSPPALVYADAIAISRRMDGVILIVRAGKSRRAAVNQALSDLQSAGANLLGSIFNQSPKSDPFSVNRAYLQERPLLPLPQALIKKESSGRNQFRDLLDSAVPLNGNLDMAHEEAKEGDIEAPLDSAVPLNGNLDMAHDHVEESEIEVQSDSAVPLNGNLDMAHDDVKESKIKVHQNTKTAGKPNHRKRIRKSKNREVRNVGGSSVQADNLVDRPEGPLDPASVGNTNPHFDETEVPVDIDQAAK